MREAMMKMKKMLLAVSGMTMVMTGVAFAEAEAPAIDQRKMNQEQRIDHGIARGQLNERETNRLDKQQAHVNKMEGRAKSDGVMTKKERARIVAAQERASRHIAREKHDRQGKRHQ
jgi:opacity protein-like surface antigen